MEGTGWRCSALLKAGLHCGRAGCLPSGRLVDWFLTLTLLMHECECDEGMRPLVLTWVGRHYHSSVLWFINCEESTQWRWRNIIAVRKTPQPVYSMSDNTKYFMHIALLYIHPREQVQVNKVMEHTTISMGMSLSAHTYWEGRRRKTAL